MHPIVVSVGPTGVSQPTTSVCSAQTPANAGPQQLVLNGVPASGSNVSTFVGQLSIAGNVATVQTTTSGAMGLGPVSGIGLPPDLMVTGPGPTAGTWLLNRAPLGTPFFGAARVSPVVSFDVPRQVLVTNTEPAGNTVAIYGTDAFGNKISEILATNGAAIQTVQNFATVTKVVVGAPPAGPISVGGATSIFTSPWVAFDPFVDVASIQKTCIVDITAGPVTYSVQITNDDPNAYGGPPPTMVAWQNDPTAAFVGATGNQVGAWNFVPMYARVIITSGSGSGKVIATFLQQGGAH